MTSQQEKEALARHIRGNKHEIFVVSFEEMDAIIQSSPAANKPGIKERWAKVKSRVGYGASYYASADDLATTVKLIGELGGVGAQAYIRNYGGKPHIILKGHPGLRRVLTGTRYGIKNPKVIAMGLGRAGAVHAAKVGGLVSIVLMTTYRVTDYVLTDEMSLSRLIGNLATDVVKVGITVAASIGAATFMGAATFAIGPIVAVCLVGVAVTAGLDHLDAKYQITDHVVAGIDEIGLDITAYLQQRKQEMTQAIADTAASVIDAAVETAQRNAIRFTRDMLRRNLPPGLGRF